MQLAVGPGCLDVLILSCHGSDMPLASRRFFSRVRAIVNSATAAVKADAVAPSFVDAGFVHVAVHPDIHVHDRAVVEEMSTLPSPAFKPVTEVAIPVVDAAIETDFWSPIAGVEKITIIAPAPIAGSPQISGFGSEHPGSGDPVIIVVICPVTRHPDVIFARALRLLVNRQLGWGDADGYAELRA